MEELARAEAPIAPRRPQARGLATRERLLRAAESLFSQKGYEGTSIGDVARGAGVGVGTVYHHFPDKRALLLELIDRWGDRREAEAPSDEEIVLALGQDAGPAIRAFVAASHEKLRDHPSIYLVTLAVANRDEEVARRYRRVEAIGRARLRHFFEVGQRVGLLRAELDPLTTAILIQNLVDSTAMRVAANEEIGADTARLAQEIGEMICRYVVPEPEPGQRSD